MRKFLIMTALLSLMAANSALAEQKSAGPPVTADSEPTHEMCKSIMGRKMDGKTLHDHSADKGAARPPVKKPLSKAEMDRMHAKCAARMATDSGAAKR